MTELQFRIIAVPVANCVPDLAQFRQYVERCGLIVNSIKRVQLEKLNEPSYAEIIEFVSDVHAVDETVISNRNKVSVYKNLCFNWCQITKNISGERPLLQLFNDECFLRKRKSSHDYICPRVEFGIQARLGEYICYKSIEDIDFLSFNHDMQEIYIKLINLRSLLDFLEGENFYSLSISYKHIRSIIIDTQNDYYFDMYLDLGHPPLFYWNKIDGDSGIVYESKRSLPYQISKTVFAKANVVHLRIKQDSRYLNLLASLRSSCDKIPFHYVAMRNVCGVPPLSPNVNFPLNEYECAYLWAAVEGRNLKILEQSRNIGTDVNNLVSSCLRDADSLEKTLKSLLSIVESGKFVNYWYAIDVLFNFYVSLKQSGGRSDYKVPKKCRLIRRVTITPSKVILWPADLMYENRILRNFNSEYFLRVIFRDDDFLPLNFRKYSKKLFEEVMKPIINGVLIGKRNYELIGWSSSQLRDHGVSMYATDDIGRTASDICRWTEIAPDTNMNIPKCFSRMGQCFSQTDDTVFVPPDGYHIICVEDIERYDPVTNTSYCFSDGIGKISQTLADEVTKCLRHREGCSAFQIRHGGCKGMLVIDPTLNGRRIIFRKSMKKFNCRGIHHTNLEIAKKSKPISLRLNRPLIALLNDLDVPHVVFLRLQEVMLQKLLDMLLDEKQAALYLHQRVPSSFFSIDDVSKSGISLTLEPFFRNLLLALHRYYIDLIKTKANIEIDPAFARNMFGVLDETGTLEYGEVFVQYSTDASKGITTPEDTKIVKGTVMVTKCPCVHPGDVRKFKAVDVQALHHIVDCIVFPQKGPRPHPDEMAGSDLDGDEFSVIWLEELFFPRENATPGLYPKNISRQYENVSEFLRYSRTNEIANFLKDYIQRDNIGVIASAHLSWADQAGIESDICIGLAEKHAIVVDFAKTGCTTRLEKNEQPKKFPDFMEKFWKKKYRSKKVLGKMYRVSKDFENANEDLRIHYQNIQVDNLLVVDGWQEYEESAVKMRNEYNSMLKIILQTYGIIHETEAIGGAFIKLHPRFRERRDRCEIVNLVHMWLNELVDQTREKFYAEFKVSQPIEILNRKMFCKASAWYVVTYRETEPEFLSFPWVVSDIIANIRILKQGVDEKDNFPLISKLDTMIIQIANTTILPNLLPNAVRLLNALHYHCDCRIVEQAVAILTKWGDEEKLTTMSNDEGKFLFYKVFLRLIIHVAELEGYVSKDRSSLNHSDHKHSTSFLIISFFKFCMKLRFLNKQQIQKALPFYVHRANVLAKKALVTYHSLTVSGDFPTLYPQEFVEKPDELIRMKPIGIDIGVIGEAPIEQCKLRNAESKLREHSEVEQIEMREVLQKKKIVVSAHGTVESLRRLRKFLYKDSARLKEFFDY